MLQKGDTKYPPWLEAEMPDALDTLSDIHVCRFMGWDFDQLESQFERHPEKVYVVINYMNAEQGAIKARREKAEQHAKSRGRGARRARRRR